MNDLICAQDVLVVIPALNEEATIERVVSEVRRAGFRCLVVDDASSDETSKNAIDAGAHVIRLPINLGVGGALRCGFRFATKQGFSAVIQVDGDGQHNVSDIQRLLEAVNLSNADVAIGSRFLSSEELAGASTIRRLLMIALAQIVSKICGKRYTDTTSGFRIIRQPILGQLAQKMPSYYLGDTLEVLIAVSRAGYLVIEVPTSMRCRQFGQPSTSIQQTFVLIGKLFVRHLLGAQVQLTRKIQI